MSLIRTPLSLIACLLLSACQSSSPVMTDYDSETDFSQYQSYQLQQENSSDDPLLTERVKDAVQRELQRSPLQFTDDNPELLIGFQLRSQLRTKKPNSYGSIGVGGGSGGSFGGISLGTSLGSDSQLKDVEIKLNMVDSGDQKLKWQATHRFSIGDDSPEQISELIEQAVREMLSQYPPGKMQ